MGLIFDNVDLEQEFGVIIDGASSWPKPERDVSYIHVPGRSGDILMDNGCWKNVNISYNFLIKDDWKTAFEDFAAWLCSHVGYFRLEDPVRHPGVYRMASFTGPLDPDLWFTTDTGVFTIEFNCKPQQWLTSGETPIQAQANYVFPGRIVPEGQVSEYGSFSDYSIEIENPDEMKSRCTAFFKVKASDVEVGTTTVLEVHIRNNSTTQKTYVFTLVYRVITQDVEIKHGFIVTNSVEPGEQAAREWTLTKTASDSNDTVWFYAISIECADGLEGDTIEVQYYRQPLNSITVSEGTKVLNPTQFQSFPTLTADTKAGGAFVINSFVATVDAANIGDVIVDCGLEDCYALNNGVMENANQYVTISNSDEKEMRDFPYFQPGENLINMFSIPGSAVDEFTEINLSIIPNWYRI